MKNIHKPKYRSIPDRDAEIDRLIARANHIAETYPDSATRRKILSRYEQEMRAVSDAMIGGARDA